VARQEQVIDGSGVRARRANSELHIVVRPPRLNRLHVAAEILTASTPAFILLGIGPFRGEADMDEAFIALAIVCGLPRCF